MKRKSVKVSGVIVFFLSFVLLSWSISGQEVKKQEETASPTQMPAGQSPPQEVQKPKLDYMSTFLSRDTSPLGLKEDQEIRQILKQSRAK
ncbi:MAG: hypothetical protein PHU81_08765, partial [Acidobacteriota bacterium]|nr:hypothetical protein [Acidobacteriota bacterium]